MRKYQIIAVSLFLLFLISGCSVDYKCKIKSDTAWSGYFDNRTVEGTGNKTVDIDDDPPACVVVQKQTASGYLTIQIYSTGGWFLNPSDENKKITTTADYGVVSDCSED